MGEPGQDSQSFQGLRTWFRGVVQDAAKLRLYSHIALVAVGWFALISPLGDRLAAARTALAKAHKNETRAKAHVHLTEQRERYLPLISGSEDLLDWQSYVLSKVDAAGVRLINIEPYKADKRGPFQIMRFNINVMSDDYAALTDFVDRLEHGERLVRLETLVLTQSSQSMVLTFMLRGVVKPGLPDIPLQDPLGASANLELVVPDELLPAPGDDALELDPQIIAELEAGAGLPAPGASATPVEGPDPAIGTDESESGL